MLGEDFLGRAVTHNPAGDDRVQLNGDGSLDKLNDQPFHEIANIWPLLGDEELRALAEDIKQSGLRYPIWRHRDGRIIDGRNRWLACQMVGLQCPSTTYNGSDGTELVSFVVSLNDKRRHLSVDQRAAVAAAG